MRDFIISVESVCDINKQILIENDIKVAPMKFMVNDVEFRSDDKDFEVPKICKFMREGATKKTSQINFYDDTDYLEKLLEEGKDVLHLSFTSGQSGTCENFMKAAEELNKTHKNKVIVVDTLCQAGGIGVLLKYLLENIEKYNFDIEKAKDFAENNKLKVCHYFTVDNLKYLIKGGRVSKTSAFIGSLLQIKPVCNLNKDGVIVPFKKVFGRKKSVVELFEYFKLKYNKDCNYVVIAEADCESDAKMLSNLIKKEFDVVVDIVPLNLVVTSHSGPGTLSLYFTANER